MENRNVNVSSINRELTHREVQRNARMVGEKNKMDAKARLLTATKCLRTYLSEPSSAFSDSTLWKEPNFLVPISAYRITTGTSVLLTPGYVWSFLYKYGLGLQTFEFSVSELKTFLLCSALLCSGLPACSCFQELFDVLGAAAKLTMDRHKGRASRRRRLITGYLLKAEWRNAFKAQRLLHWLYFARARLFLLSLYGLLFESQRKYDTSINPS